MKTFPLSEKQTKYFLELAKNSKSGFIGVSWYEFAQKWKASIQQNGQAINIGLFDDPVKAAIARDNKAIELWGSNAVTNDGLGLFKKEERAFWVPDGERLEKRINQALPKHLQYFGRMLFKLITFAREQGVTFLEAIRQQSELNRISKKDRAKIITCLEREKLIYVDKQNNNSVDKNRIYSVSYPPKQLIKDSEMNIKNGTSMTQEKATSLEHRSPEELAAMAQELLKLSEAKKQEIANGDVIKKTLRPLILNCFQAKGKFERQLNQLLDISTELDNALNALRDAMN